LASSAGGGNNLFAFTTQPGFCFGWCSFDPTFVDEIAATT
jgi:hypothetical protein